MVLFCPYSKTVKTGFIYTNCKVKIIYFGSIDVPFSVFNMGFIIIYALRY